VNADHVGNPPSAVFASYSGSTFGMPKAQPTDHFLAQFSPRHGVDRCVDGFVGHLQRGRFRMHNSQCARNLLGGVAPFQISHDLLPQCGSWLQPPLHTRNDRAGTGPLVSGFGTVSASYWWTPRTTARLRPRPIVSTKFSRNRRWRTIQPQGNRRWRDSIFQLHLDLRSLFNTQLLVDFSHATLSPENVALGI